MMIPTQTVGEIPIPIPSEERNQESPGKNKTDRDHPDEDGQRDPARRVPDEVEKPKHQVEEGRPKQQEALELVPDEEPAVNPNQQLIR